ncbi:four-carbon acid sugar kinase family protein [Ramlibacter sp. MAHUQ-53]|uniref:four-carbon acid sugar kinase family protein n=1 Tax=unclassified Ramlibacter TaxID=2617605 RepID=UPI00363EE30F
MTGAVQRLRILADDLTGALDCAAAFGAGAPVHLGRPASPEAPGLDLVATATRDVPVADLPSLLAPCVPWLRGADLAFKKVDSLLRGNTFDEADHLARAAGLRGLAFAPAFPAQGRLTEGGQQWWVKADGTRTAVAASIREALAARGWRVETGATPPAPAMGDGLVAWVPDVRGDADMDAVAARAVDAGAGWLWCGSAGLAHALARRLPAARPAGSAAPASPASPDVRAAGDAGGPVMLVSASHHPVSREQWQVLRGSPRGGDCLHAEDPRTLARDARGYPPLVDLCASGRLSPGEAAQLLDAQARALAAHAPRPRVLVVVGGDTLLALCRHLGATGLTSQVPLDRPGWGCARMVGGRWDGLVCHTRSGAFGGPRDLLEVVGSV